MSNYKELIEELRSEAENMRECNHDPWAADDYDKAAEAIEQLVKERDELYMEVMDCTKKIGCKAIEQVKKERDTAVADIKKCWLCVSCRNHIETKEWCFCYHFAPEMDSDGCTTCENYEWRGVQE